MRKDVNECIRRQDTHHLCRQKNIPFPSFLHVYIPHLDLKFLKEELEDLILLA